MKRVEVTVNTFDKYADQYQAKYMEYGPYIETYRYLSSLLKADSEVLDAACGPGNISKFLLDENPQIKVHGIDLSPRMIALARANNPTAFFEIMDSREISSLERQYDVIVSGFCFPYLSKEEVEKFITDARTVISSGGIFYLSTMEGDYENSGYQSKSDKDQVYIYYHQSGFLIDLLESHGFQIIRIERKSSKADDASKAVDLFIYARAC